MAGQGSRERVVAAVLWIVVAAAAALVVWGAVAADRGYRGGGRPALAPAPGCYLTHACPAGEASAR